MGNFIESQTLVEIQTQCPSAPGSYIIAAVRQAILLYFIRHTSRGPFLFELFSRSHIKPPLCTAFPLLPYCLFLFLALSCLSSLAPFQLSGSPPSPSALQSSRTMMLSSSVEVPSPGGMSGLSSLSAAARNVVRSSSISGAMYSLEKSPGSGGPDSASLSGNKKRRSSLGAKMVAIVGLSQWSKSTQQLNQQGQFTMSYAFIGCIL